MTKRPKLRIVPDYGTADEPENAPPTLAQIEAAIIDEVSPRTVGEDMELDPWKYDGYDGPRGDSKPGADAHLELRRRKAAAAAAKEAGKVCGRN